MMQEHKIEHGMIRVTRCVQKVHMCNAWTRLCKRFSENEKLIEFCGRSNKAVLFVVIVVYFGGTRRGCIMIPASSNHVGWSLF